MIFSYLSIVRFKEFDRPLGACFSSYREAYRNLLVDKIIIMRSRSLLETAGLGVFGAAAIVVGGFYASYYLQSKHTFDQATLAVSTLEVGGVEFRDLNKNGLLDVYENPAANISDRVEDLLVRMSLEEKAGLMLIAPISVRSDGSLRERPSFDDVISLAMPINSEWS